MIAVTRRLLLLASLALVVLSAGAQETPADSAESPPGPIHLRFDKAALSLDLRFLDENGNNALDAEEEGRLAVTVVNEGPGKAYRVRLRGKIASGPKEVTGSLDKACGTIGPGEKSEAVLLLSAGERLPNDMLSIRVEATEKYGREARPLDVKLETRALVPPDLQIVDYGIDDDDQGTSYGNGNGKIEPGETIEVAAIVQNRGQGIGENVAVDVVPAPGVFYMGRKRFHLGDLAPGDHGRVEFAFGVKSEPPEGDLPFTLKVVEARGRFGTEKNISFAWNAEEKRAGALAEPERVRITPRGDGTFEIADAPTVSVDVERNVPRALEENGNGIAVLIGNRRYSDYHPDVPDVEFAARDAAVMKEYVVRVLGYKEGNVLHHTDATNAVFRSLFGTREVPGGRLAELVKPGESDLFVYYSGHGAPSLSGGESRGYFVPVDCAPSDVRLNGYPLDLFYENLGRLGARSVMVVIDACFSGMSDAGTLLEAISGAVVEPVEPAARIERRAVFTSSGGKEVSSWYPEKSHGLFTYFFLKGLQGSEADRNRDGALSAGELYDYLADRTEGVPYWARYLHSGRAQTPRFSGDRERVVRGRVQ